MPILTYLARFTDGMLLVASTEHAGDQYQNLDEFKKYVAEDHPANTVVRAARCAAEVDRTARHVTT